MKRLSILSLLIVILATSCQTSSELGSTALIQKRRYTKGFNLNVKKPTITNNDENRTEDNLAMVQANTSAATVHIENPTSELKSVKANKTDLAAIELSETLIADANKESAENNEVFSATPTALNDAYPLTLDNKSRTNLDYSNATKMAASGEATLLVIILTILLPPLGVALVFGISTEFWISLILTLLFYFPGLIYSLIVIL